MSAFLVPALSTEQALVLTPGQTGLPHVPDSPFHNLLGLSRTEMAASRELEAPERLQAAAEVAEPAGVATDSVPDSAAPAEESSDLRVIPRPPTGTGVTGTSSSGPRFSEGETSPPSNP